MFLAGCETADEQAAREQQFDGRHIDEVINKIGPPQSQNMAKAVWQYQETVRQRIPVQGYENGRYVITGYRYDRVRLACTYTAFLSDEHVVQSFYDGNACRRFAP